LKLQVVVLLTKSVSRFIEHIYYSLMSPVL